MTPAPYARNSATSKAAADAIGDLNRKKCGPLSLEHRTNIANAKRGKKRPPFSLEWRAKLSAALIGNKRAVGSVRTPEERAKISITHKGFPLSPEHRAKISTAKRGKKKKPFSKEHRAKMSAAHKGYKHSPEARARMSIAQGGPNHPQWRGGISREPYGWEFNKKLKEEVRRRDGYKCQLCNVPQTECDGTLNIHHINYDKKDNDPLNLVALCHSCHSRTIARRMLWTIFFQERYTRRCRRAKVWVPTENEPDLFEGRSDRC